MRISDWSSDVCSSDLGGKLGTARRLPVGSCRCALAHHRRRPCKAGRRVTSFAERSCPPRPPSSEGLRHSHISCRRGPLSPHNGCRPETCSRDRSEEHTSELQSLMRTSYAVICVKHKHTKIQAKITQTTVESTTPQVYHLKNTTANVNHKNT